MLKLAVLRHVVFFYSLLLCALTCAVSCKEGALVATSESSSRMWCRASLRFRRAVRDRGREEVGKRLPRVGCHNNGQVEILLCKNWSQQGPHADGRVLAAIWNDEDERKGEIKKRDEMNRNRMPGSGLVGCCEMSLNEGWDHSGR